MAAAVQHSFMKLFRRGGGQHKESEGRLKLQKELYQYNECVEYGFPAKPSALAHDPFLQLLAIGTRCGSLYLYGAPGVRFVGYHDKDATVTQIFFVGEQGRIVTVCGDNSLHLWELNVRDGATQLEKVRSLTLEERKFKQVSKCCLSRDGTRLLAGSEGGNVHLLDLTSFSLLDHVIYQDVIMQNVPDDFKVSPGAVEAIEQHPTDDSRFLIGYNRGLIVLWDSQDMRVEQTYNASQQLESLAWHRDGTQFMSAHSDGSYIVWETEVASRPKEQATPPYGPFPCKPITKILWRNTKTDPYIVFSGGMPRASYGDRNTVSVMQGTTHQVLDFTSRVVDFAVLSTADSDTAQGDERTEFDDPHTLVCLLEEELVLIDLAGEGWPEMHLPVMPCLHAAPITCTAHVAAVPDELWDKVVRSGRAQTQAYSDKAWPFRGGRDLRPEAAVAQARDLLLTGHEDGSVRFWDASGVSMSLVYRLKTAAFFGLDHVDNPEDQEDWPPFRKAGQFDPYSDDPRLGVQKMSLCVYSETLTLAGTAGQVMVLRFSRNKRSYGLNVVQGSLVQDYDGFVWKGHDAMTTVTEDIEFPEGFQPSAVLQLTPPAAVTALAVHSEWQLLGVGTAHGCMLFDYLQQTPVLTHCTLNPGEMTGTDETHISRRKSLKKSLRQSFRRLRKGRSQRKNKKQPDSAKVEEVKGGGASASGGASGHSSPSKAGPSSSHESPHRPVERQIEARSTDDGMASVVRSLQFADTFLLNASVHGPTIWVGTNGGHVLIYTVVIPSNDKRDSEKVTARIAKEIKLKHAAPVLRVAIVDRVARVLPEPFESVNGLRPAPDYSGTHHAVIVSEEQVKVFELPKLRPITKQKLTAVEGAKVRRTEFPAFSSRSDENYAETCVTCLTNLGTVFVYRVPSLRLQLQAQAVHQDDHIGVNSAVLTRTGVGYFLSSSTQFSCFSLSARRLLIPSSLVEVREEFRPVVPDVPQDDTASEEGGEGAAEAVAEAMLDLDLSQDRSNLPAEITMDDIRVHTLGEDEVREAEAVIAEAENTATEGGEAAVQEAARAAGDATAAQAATAQAAVAETPAAVTEGATGAGGDAEAPSLEDLQIREEGEN